MTNAARDLSRLKKGGGGISIVPEGEKEGGRKTGEKASSCDTRLQIGRRRRLEKLLFPIKKERKNLHSGEEREDRSSLTKMS